MRAEQIIEFGAATENDGYTSGRRTTVNSEHASNIGSQHMTGLVPKYRVDILRMGSIIDGVTYVRSTLVATSQSLASQDIQNVRPAHPEVAWAYAALCCS